MSYSDKLVKAKRRMEKALINDYVSKIKIIRVEEANFSRKEEDKKFST